MTTPEETASAAKTSDGETDVEREVRFAVVMYGGVSLAIYINGVAQELLNMVRATAPKTWEEESGAARDARESELPGAMRVYRKLGQYLALRDPELRKKKLLQSDPTTDPIRFRFVVDVIS